MCSLLFASQIEIPGNVTKVDVADDLEWPFVGHCFIGFIVSVSNIQHAQCIKSITTVGCHI